MILGAAAIMTAAMIASVVLSSFIDWTSPAKMLGASAAVTLPILLGGAGALTGGRWIYGGWNERSPVTNAIAYGIRTAGLILACALGLMLVFVVASGVKPEDMRVAVTLGFGITASIGLILIGFGMPTGSNRSYPG